MNAPLTDGINCPFCGQATLGEHGGTEWCPNCGAEFAPRVNGKKVYFGFAIGDSMFPYGNLKKEAVSPERVREMAEAKELIPCLNPSHLPTIQAMREKFGIEVPIPEVAPRVSLNSSDAIIVMGIRGLPRLSDARHEYTAEEVAEATFEFSYYEVIA